MSLNEDAISLEIKIKKLEVSLLESLAKYGANAPTIEEKIQIIFGGLNLNANPTVDTTKLNVDQKVYMILEDTRKAAEMMAKILQKNREN